MEVRTAKVINVYGIHCRPSAEILKKVAPMDSTIEISANGAKSSLTSIIELLALGIKCGDTVMIKVDGPNAATDADSIMEAFETNYDFER